MYNNIRYLEVFRRMTTFIRTVLNYEKLNVLRCNFRELNHNPQFPLIC